MTEVETRTPVAQLEVLDFDQRVALERQILSYHPRSWVDMKMFPMTSVTEKKMMYLRII